ncbi:MAG: acyltransferase, partial [Jatrophihabitans sp.]
AVTTGWVLVLGLPASGWLLGLAGGGTYTTDLIEAAGGKPHVSSFFEYTWSLAVEEQFYLIWPLLVVGLVLVSRRLSRWTLGGCCLLLAAASVADRAALVAAHASSERVNFALDTNVAPIALGAVLAVLTSRGVPRRVRGGASLVGAVALGLLALIATRPAWAPSWHLHEHRFGLLPLLAVLAVAGLALAPLGGAGRLVGVRPLAYLGRLSYGLYLWNMLFMDGFTQILGRKPAHAGWAGLVWALALVAVCALSHRYVEVPLRRRWAHRRVPAVVATTPLPVAV